MSQSPLRAQVLQVVVGGGGDVGRGDVERGDVERDDVEPKDVERRGVKSRESQPTDAQNAKGDATCVSALALDPPQPLAALVLAHGAGAGITHPFMQALAEALAAGGVATLRYQFPYMEAGSRRPDAPALCHRTVRSAVAMAATRWPGLALFAGGKSFGGRMSSQAQAEAPLTGVRGLVFFGFPLHPAGRPATTRADHLQAIGCPLLFLQGSRDKLADLALLRPLMPQLRRPTLEVIADADHAFHVPVKSGRTDAQVLRELARATAAWMQTVLQGTTTSRVG